MSSVATFLIFLTLVLTRTKVLSFNIEDRDAVAKKLPEKGSYFGFSVAQHVVMDESNPSQRDFWILVGAPLGRNLQPGTNHSGALYKCPISSYTDDCVQVETDGKRLKDFDYEETPVERAPPPLQMPGPDEIKENQWMGVTVKSQKPGGKVVVCAHRYIQSTNLSVHHYGMGLCYLLSNNLELEEDLQPCKGRPMDKLHLQYGYCQAGTSLAVLHDGYAIMGAPGPFTWRGTIFAKSVVGSYIYKDKTIYKGPLNGNRYPIDKYSYLGMSATGGYFFNKTNMSYVSGAPRSNFSGQVYFFNKVTSVEEMTIHLILSGDQFASSYGYEILATDIDQDGFDELLVGAPFYYEQNAGGAVYIYKNVRSCTNTICKPKVLTGKPESRFGFAMTSLGDINKDGFTDVAIGAPYESGGGAVYIYLGSAEGYTKPSQVIRVSGISTLGYSLSGGIDMDLNDYPDLLVGAYDSDMAILYLTRPIIDITIKVEGDEWRNINATKRGCGLDSTTNKTCFSFQTCFEISKFHLSESLEVRYEIKELPTKIPRVAFNDTRNALYITVDDVAKTYCQTETVYLVEGNGDILSPIKFLVNYTLRNDVANLTSASSYSVRSPSPILNKTSAKEFEATFHKNCGDDGECTSHLILNADIQLEKIDNEYVLMVGENREFLLDANVTNSAESAYEAKLFVEHSDALSYVALQYERNKSGNFICTSINGTSIVVCNLGNPFQPNQTANLRLRFEVKETTQQKVAVKVFVNSTSIETSNQTSQSFTAKLQKIAVFQIKGEGKPPNIFYAGKVRGQSDMEFLEDIGPRVVHTYKIVNGQWHMMRVQVEILWPYQVYTDRQEGGKWLLYLEREPLIDSNETNRCLIDKTLNALNPLKLKQSGLDDTFSELGENITTGKRSRLRRDVEEVIQAETKIGRDGKQRKVVTMDCLKKTAKCVKITCLIPVMHPNAVVKIQLFGRVWNSTLVEDYSQVDWVSIRSFGQVLIGDETLILRNESVSETAIETVALPSVVLADTSLDIWIIVGSVIAGLILLIILIIILYKCGFFKRNRIKDHTLSGNLKKQGENETLLKENEGKPAK